jgi:hypothetical protein
MSRFKEIRTPDNKTREFDCPARLCATGKTPARFGAGAPEGTSNLSGRANKIKNLDPNLSLVIRS